MSFSASNTRKTSMPLSAAFSHEPVDDAVLVVAVAHQVLAAQQHLQRRLRHPRLERAQPLPRVLVEEPDARVERGAAPALERPEAGVVEVLARRDHVLGGHARRHQALVRVAQDQFGDVDGSRAQA